MRWCSFAVQTLIVGCGVVCADDPAPERVPSLPAEIRPLPTPLVPQAVPQLAGDVQYLPAAAETVPPPALVSHVPSMSKVAHLREAARHLEAAGYGEQAQELRNDADELVAAAELLKQKRAVLDQLQREITELEATTGECQQIMLRCRIVEIDRAAVRQMGFKQYPSNPAVGALAPRELNGLEDELVRRQLAKVVAEPTLVTLNGRPCSLRIGGEIPIILPAVGDTASIKWRETGLGVEAVPVCLGGDRLRLDLAVEIATPDFTTSAVTVAGNAIPGMTVRRVNTQIEMQFGETKVIGGMISRRDAPAPQADGAVAEDPQDRGRDTELVFIVTAESVQGISAASSGDHEPPAIPVPR